MLLLLPPGNSRQWRYGCCVLQQMVTLPACTVTHTTPSSSRREPLFAVGNAWDRKQSAHHKPVLRQSVLCETMACGLRSGAWSQQNSEAWACRKSGAASFLRGLALSTHLLRLECDAGGDLQLLLIPAVLKQSHSRPVGKLLHSMEGSASHKQACGTAAY